MRSPNDSSSMIGQLFWNKSDLTDFFLSLNQQRAKVGLFYGPLSFADSFVFHVRGLFQPSAGLDWSKTLKLPTGFVVGALLLCFCAQKMLQFLLTRSLLPIREVGRYTLVSQLSAALFLSVLPAFITLCFTARPLVDGIRNRESLLRQLEGGNLDMIIISKLSLRRLTQRSPFTPDHIAERLKLYSLGIVFFPFLKVCTLSCHIISSPKGSPGCLRLGQWNG